MASSPTSGDATSTHTRSLPSLFGEHSINGGGNSATVGGKDLDGLINDSALSQQIEFILQDGMEQDDEHDVNIERRRALELATNASNISEVNVKLENPPTTSVVTSASEYGNGHASAAEAIVSTQDHHILNGRRIIIQTTQAAGMLHAMQHSDGLEDPELNDENLQDIEEEAQAAEAEDEDDEQMHTQVKLEHDIDGDDQPQTAEMEYITDSPIHAHAQLAGQPPQLVLPAGSIVSTTSRALAVPVSEALAQLHRRPVYISNAVGGMAGATFVRMPAVISRSPMTVLNVVQQGVAGATGQTTQLILQATPVTNTPTPVVVSSAVAPVTVTSVGDMSTTAPQQQQPPPPTAIIATAPPISTANTTSAVIEAIASTSSSNMQATTAAAAAPPAPSSVTTYQCVECVEKFESKELFDIHRSGHANNMKCAICNMVLKSLKNYEKHCLRCKPYECQICGRVVRFRPNFIKHMRVHTGQQSERHKYKCDVCHKEFMSFEYFKVHKKIHNENVNLTCEICGKVFSALASLRGHSKLHSGVKLHKCDVCGKGFGQRYNLKIHARTHTGDFPFECKVCKKKLHTQSSLQTHMQVHQRDQNAQVSSTAGASNGNANAAVSTATGVTMVKIEQPSTSGLQQQQLLHQQEFISNEDDDEMDGHSNLSDNDATAIVSTSVNKSLDDSSNSMSSNGSQELRTQQLMLASHTPTRTIVFKNYVHDDAASGSHAAQLIAQQQKVIHATGNSGNATLQQQLLRKTPIIHSTGGATTLSSALASVVQQTGSSPSPSPSSSSTSCSSSVVVSKTGAPLSLASAAIGTSTIRSTRNLHQTHLGSSSSSSAATLSNQQQQQQHQNNHHRSLQRNSNHRNHHRRRHPTDIDDDDDDDQHHPNPHHQHTSSSSSSGGNIHHPHHPHHRLTLHHAAVNGRHFDDDDDDEKSSPSLATAAIIKVEPNLYSSGSGDNSNEMLIKEEVMFEDSAAPHSPHSPPSSKFRMSNFDSDLVDHHVDLNHSLPPYGNLFEPHSIPDSIPGQLYPDDDDDFRLDHSSLGALHNTSSSTTDGDFIKKEWVYGAGSSYAMNGKFDDDSDALCDAANFIYN